MYSNQLNYRTILEVFSCFIARLSAELRCKDKHLFFLCNSFAIFFIHLCYILHNRPRQKMSEAMTSFIGKDTLSFEREDGLFAAGEFLNSLFGNQIGVFTPHRSDTGNNEFRFECKDHTDFQHIA